MLQAADFLDCVESEDILRPHGGQTNIAECSAPAPPQRRGSLTRMPAAAARGVPPQRFRDEIRGLVLHSSSALFMRAFRSLASFAFNVVLARLLGAEGTGMYFLALSITELSTLIARMGMDATVVRLLAGGRGRTRAFYHRVLLLVTATGLAMTGVVQMMAPFVCVHLFGEPGLVVPLRIMAMGIAPWALVFIHGSLLQSAGRIALSIFIHYVGAFVIGIPFLLVLAWDGSLTGAALSQVAATLSVLAAGAFVWRRTVAGGFELADEELAPGMWGAAVRASLSLAAIGILFAAGSHADTFLLGALTTMSDVGTFRVAFRIAVLGGAALEAVGTAIAPRMAAHHSRGDLRALEATARAGTALAVAISVPYWLLVLGFPDAVLGLFGSEFTVGSGAMVLLIAGKIVSTVSGPVATLLIMAGHERELRNLTLLVTLGHVALLPFVIPIWGFVGVAAVCCLSSVANNLGATLLIRRTLGIVALPLPSRVLPYHVNDGSTR